MEHASNVFNTQDFCATCSAVRIQLSNFSDASDYLCYRCLLIKSKMSELKIGTPGWEQRCCKFISLLRNLYCQSNTPLHDAPLSECTPANCELSSFETDLISCFSSKMRDVTDWTYAPVGGYYDTNTNCFCTQEWHPDSYYECRYPAPYGCNCDTCITLNSTRNVEFRQINSNLNQMGETATDREYSNCRPFRNCQNSGRVDALNGRPNSNSASMNTNSTRRRRNGRRNGRRNFRGNGRTL